MTATEHEEESLAEKFRARREESQARRERHRQMAPEMLRQAGFRFLERNDGAHLIVEDRVDFWPGTGRWMVRTSGRVGYGIVNLIAFLRFLGGGR